MSNDALITAFDPLAKTNLFDFILSDELYQLKNTQTEKSNITLDEYENKYHITIPEPLIGTWEKHTWVYFNRICNDLSQEHYARNEHIQVHVFLFSIENRYLSSDLYRVIWEINRDLEDYWQSIGVDNSTFRSLLNSEKEYLTKCYRVCADLTEEYNNRFYREIFYFDAMGNIDSVRFCANIESVEASITTFLDSIIKRKNEFAEYMQHLKDAEENRSKKEALMVELKKIEHPIVGPYMKNIPKCLKGFHNEIEHEDHEWEIHHGDLIIDGDWKPDNINLLITGNLHVNGFYDGYDKGYSFVVVMGDMTADHIVCWFGLSIVGNLTVKGIINLEHYLFPLEVAGNIQARHLSIQHSQRYVHWNSLNVDSSCQNGPKNDFKVILKNINPALLAESIMEDDLESVKVSFDATINSLHNGILPFRETPLSDDILEKIIFYSEDNEYSHKQLLSDMKLDPLLALTIACYNEIDDEASEILKGNKGFYGKYFDEAIDQLT